MPDRLVCRGGASRVVPAADREYVQSSPDHAIHNGETDQTRPYQEFPESARPIRYRHSASARNASHRLRDHSEQAAMVLSNG